MSWVEASSMGTPRRSASFISLVIIFNWVVRGTPSSCSTSTMGVDNAMEGCVSSIAMPRARAW